MTSAARALPGLWLAGWTLAVALALTFALLGRWQYGRMQAKHAMLQDVHTATTRPPLALSAALRASDTAYHAVATTGQFVDAPPLLLDNQMRDGRAGVRVFRLFRPHSHAGLLLVELGWLPLDAQRHAPPASLERPNEQAVQLHGLLMPPPSAGLSLGPAVQLREHAWWLTRLDIAALHDALPADLRAPLIDRVLRPDPALALGFARDADILPNTLPPDRHLGYAVQWFALAAAVLVTAAVVTLNAFRKRRPHA